MDKIILLEILMFLKRGDEVALPTTRTAWTDEQMSHINIFFVEYISQANKVDCTEFSPTTFDNYLDGIGRDFKN